MFCVVGHGPSVVRRPLGAIIDRCTVIRLKGAPRDDPSFWGKRTDIVCARHAHQFLPIPGAELWLANHPTSDAPTARTPDMGAFLRWWAGFSTRKPTTGLCALYMLAEFNPGAVVGLIGFDALLHPKRSDFRKWLDDVPRNWPAHDRAIENKAMQSLGLDIRDMDADY